MLALAAATLPRSVHVSILGAHGHLGRELVRQSLDRDWNVTALVRRPADAIYEPSRIGWLHPDEGRRHPIRDERLHVLDARGPLAETLRACDAAVIALAPRASVEECDPSCSIDDTVRRVCDALSPATRVCLVSSSTAWRDGDASLAWRYAARHVDKAAQEEFVRRRFPHHRIVRPRVLSFSTPSPSPDGVSRYALATDILSWIDDASVDDAVPP